MSTETCTTWCEKNDHPGAPHIACSATAKTGPCKVHADRVEWNADGEAGKHVPVCHVHHSKGKFQQNLSRTREVTTREGARTVECPTCGAAIGEPCTGPRRRGGKVSHADRHRSATAGGAPSIDELGGGGRLVSSLEDLGILD